MLDIILIVLLLFQPSSIERDDDSGKMTVKFMSKTSPTEQELPGEISDADCVLFAVGRNPSSQNIGLENLVREKDASVKIGRQIDMSFSTFNLLKDILEKEHLLSFYFQRYYKAFIEQLFDPRW